MCNGIEKAREIKRKRERDGWGKGSSRLTLPHSSFLPSFSALERESNHPSLPHSILTILSINTQI